MCSPAVLKYNLMSDLHLPHIHLFGNPEENFYSLGRRDKNGHAQMYDQISKLCARSQHLVKVLKMTTEISSKFGQKKTGILHQELKAYADGLERPIDEVYFMLLLPEIVASFNKWLPHLLGIIPGCSSLFIKDPNNGGIVHGRVLDYALAGPFEKYERCITYEFKNRLKSFTHSTVGMPFPSLTTINEKGLTLALHYKHGDYFDTSGESIFSLIYQLASYCTNVHEVKKYLKANPSMAYWGIYCSDQLGNVASFDIKGSEVYQEKFEMNEHKYLYFNNRPLIIDPESDHLQPYGNLDQCLMRKQVVKKKMEKFNYQAKNISVETLKTLASIDPHKKEDASDWKLNPITPSSIQAVTFNNKDFTSYFIPGQAPKLYRGDVIEIKNVFSQSKQKEIKRKFKIDENYLKGQQAMAMAQSDMDNGHIERAYHNLQMSVEYFEGYPERFVCQFFFLVWQYIHEASNKDLGYIYHDLVALESKLPTYLNDHRILFILRLNKILDFGEDPQLSKKIKNNQLKVIYEKENKMRPTALKLIRRFIIPRIEFLDIIYIYA
jgi:hypothetical protein